MIRILRDQPQSLLFPFPTLLFQLNFTKFIHFPIDDSKRAYQCKIIEKIKGYCARTSKPVIVNHKIHSQNRMVALEEGEVLVVDNMQSCT